VFGKGMSNGYPMAAIIGRSEVMSAAQSSFISSTYWTERIGPTAALATISKYSKLDVSKHLIRIGGQVKNGWEKLAKENGLSIHVSGIDPLGHFSFDKEQAKKSVQKNEPLVLKTLFTQLMFEKGFLATTAFYASYAHKEEHVAKYLEAVDESFRFISKAVAKGDAERELKGPVCHADFKRLT
jgi:glutamate-1-semialdehyde aminotransferase